MLGAMPRRSPDQRCKRTHPYPGILLSPEASLDLIGPPKLRGRMVRPTRLGPTTVARSGQAGRVAQAAWRVPVDPSARVARLELQAQ